MSEIFEITTEDLSSLKELAAYADEVLLNVIKDAANSEYVYDRDAALEMCNAILLDLVNLTQRIDPNDPQFKVISDQAKLLLYSDKQDFSRARAWRKRFNEVASKLSVVRTQLNNRDNLIADYQRHAIKPLAKLPPIVVLCGSTRFVDIYDQTSLKFTLEGWIVLSVGSHKHSDKELVNGNHEIVLPDSKIKAAKPALDELHLRKIDLADLVYIINKDGYVGDSTRSEIKYAAKTAKTIQFLEPKKAFSTLVDGERIWEFNMPQFASGGPVHYHNPTIAIVRDCAACLNREADFKKTFNLEVPASPSQAPELTVHDMEQFSDEKIRLHDDEYLDEMGRPFVDQAAILQAHFIAKCQICQVRQGGPRD